jgi:hypothetical protein
MGLTLPPKRPLAVHQVQLEASTAHPTRHQPRIVRLCRSQATPPATYIADSTHTFCTKTQRPLMSGVPPLRQLERRPRLDLPPTDEPPVLFYAAR